MSNQAEQVPPRWPRRRLGRWIAILVAAIILVPLLAYVFWGWMSGASLRREIARLEADGEPMTMAALKPAEVDPQQNGYRHIRAAMALLPKDDEKNPLYKARESPRHPLFEDEREALHALVPTYGPALQALAPVLDTPVIVADTVEYKSPAIEILLPDLSGLRRLTNAVNYAAMHEFDSGRHDGAMRQLRLIEPVARGAGSHPGLIGSLVAVGCRAVEAGAVMHMAPELKVGDEPGAVSPVEARAVIARLLDDKPMREGMLWAMKAERAFQLDTLRAIAEGRLSIAQVTGPGGAPAGAGSRLMGFASRSVVWSNARYSVRFMTNVIEQLDAPDWPTAKSRLDPFEHDLTKLSPWRHVFVRMLSPSILRATETHFRVMTDRRLAATALAIRLYQADHQGRFPSSLTDLVPEYLPAIPTDPMSAGAPLRYHGEGDRPVIWSVGADGVDNNASTEPARPGDTLRHERWLTKDAVAPLVLPPREASVIEPDDR